MQQPKISTDQILARLNIDALNEMQQASLESNDKNKDIILLSNTGSGKTLAFLLPLLANLDEENKQIQAMIIVPSRELAMQIEKVFKQMGTGYKITCCYGGHKREITSCSLLR
jgi:ATP-dependent RNA helicase DeaD